MLKQLLRLVLIYSIFFIIGFAFVVAVRGDWTMTKRTSVQWDRPSGEVLHYMVCVKLKPVGECVIEQRVDAQHFTWHRIPTKNHWIYVSTVNSVGESTPAVLFVPAE